MKSVKYLSLLILGLALSVYMFREFSGNEVRKKYESSENESEYGNIPEYDWFEKQRAYPFQEIPNEERIKSIEYVKKNMPVAEFDGLVNWTPAGPTNVEGRITTVAIHTSNPQIVYAGCANGGLWKTTNYCQSWVSIFDNQNTSSIGAIALDPSNPEIIYCGTGEANSLRSYYAGTGLYKSTNGGENWMLSALPNSFSIGGIAVNPLNTNEVYVAVLGYLRRNNTERGVYKSTNGGVNWTQSLYVADSVGAVDVVIDPANPSKVFAAMWERTRRENYVKYGGPKSALYVTSNSGANWSIVNGGFPSNSSSLGRTSLDICYSNPNIIYALISLTNGNTGGLYKSTNGGVNWTQINTSVGGSSNYAWFNRICKVSPANPNNVFCGGLSMEYSSNGGTLFNIANTSHVDEHAVAFSISNPSYVVIGNDGGVNYSTNGGANFTRNAKLPITQFYAGDIDYNNPNTLIGGTQDNGTEKTTGAAGNWSDIYGGDGFYCLIDYSNPLRVYACSQNGGVGRSTNGGTSFISATTGLDLTYSNWSTPYVMDKNNPLTLYLGTYKIFKTTNGMQSWTAISPDLANGHVQNLGTISTVDVSKSNPSVIYCGTDDANVWVTTNGGTNWSKIINGLPNRWVTRVTIHPDSANVCYVTLSGYKIDTAGAHIYRTSNYGQNWISLRGNLPDAPINDIVINPNAPSTLYIATDVGVMVSTNMGSFWSVLADGIPSTVPCHDLTYHSPTGKLVVWTHGRSAYYIMLPPTAITGNNSSAPVSYTLQQNFPNPFNPETKIRFEIPASLQSSRMSQIPYERSGVPFGSIGTSIGDLVLLKVFDITGREIATLINDRLSSGVYEITFNAGQYQLSSGVYFYNLRAGDFSQTKSMALLK